MKLASLPQGRDGRLIVVSNDLAWYADADHIVATLQGALDDWDRLAPALHCLYFVRKLSWVRQVWPPRGRQE